MATSNPTNNENDLPRSSHRRRSSIADSLPPRPFESSSPTSSSQVNGASKQGQPNGTSMASAMAQSAQQSRTRRLSITTLGLSGSPTRGSAFESLRERSQSGAGLARPAEGRQRSQSYTSSENAIEEDGDSVGPMPNGEGYAANAANGTSRPTSPSLQRRLSFGARAASGSSTGGTNGDSNGNINASKVSPPLSAKREGFNWQENLRNRAQRSSVSTAGPAGPFAGFNSGNSPSNTHNRSKSIAVGVGSSTAPGSRNVSGEPPPPTPATPGSNSGFGNAKPVPAPPKAPDHFQERILKGDFMMD